MAAPEFVTQLQQLAVGGVDLKRALDLISGLRVSRLTNLDRTKEGAIAPRPGQRLLGLIPGAANVHTIARLHSALGDAFIRVIGADATLYYQDPDGLLHELEEGFSGAPFSLVAGRPRGTSDSWLYLGDSVQMRKVRAPDGVVTPVGVRPPTAAGIATPYSPARTPIDLFETAGWTNNAGSGGTPANALDTTNLKEGTASVAFTAAVGSAVSSYYNFWGKAAAAPINLSRLISQFGDIPAGDDDQVHLWLRLDDPTAIQEIRVYFVVSENFSATTFPGSSATLNTDAYFKSFIPSLFASYVNLAQTAPDALAELILQRTTEGDAEELPEREGETQIRVESQDEQRGVATRQLALGKGVWTEFGAAGSPLRRSEFLRIGSDTARDWSTVTGVIIAVRTMTNTAVQINFDDMYLVGGYAPDTSAATSIAYDYRYRNLDLRTGARSRLSPIMEEKIDVVRGAIRLFPEAYGDPNFRQEWFRRGGTLKNLWYFIGRNQSDGGCGLDKLADSVAQASLTIDDATDYYHQPVTTVDDRGDTVYAVPIPVIFGPIEGMLFGLGDPYRKGYLYNTLADEWDHWPPLAYLEVCSPDEELMGGVVFGGTGFVFSRKVMYQMYVQPGAGIGLQVRTVPTLCGKGLAARQAVVVGPDGIYFIAEDAGYVTTGGIPKDITSDFIQGLFGDEEVNGYSPIDFDVPEAIRLEVFLNELWFTFQDQAGNRQTWIYSIVFTFWRHYHFAVDVGAVYSEVGGRLLLGGAKHGGIFELAGRSDNGQPISCHVRTGGLNMGMPRAQKLFGDVSLEAELDGTPVTLQVLLDRERTALPAVVVPATAETSHVVEAFGASPVKARDAALDLTFEVLERSPSIYRIGPSFIPQPEAIVGRSTEWDELSGLHDKLMKGVLIEADTYGFPKTLVVYADGGSDVKAQILLQTTGRQVQHFAWPSFYARVVRLQGAPGDTAPWIPYEVKWLFDSDPLMLDRWETQPTDHGLPVPKQTLCYAYITLLSTTDVTLTLTAYSQAGAAQVESVVIPSTGGVKQKAYVTLPALGGALFSYLFTSAAAHRLYREESTVWVLPWGAEAPTPVQPFGTDALDVSRIVRDAEGAVARGAKWLDTDQAAGQT